MMFPPDEPPGGCICKECYRPRAVPEFFSRLKKEGWFAEEPECGHGTVFVCPECRSEETERCDCGCGKFK